MKHNINKYFVIEVIKSNRFVLLLSLILLFNLFFVSDYATNVSYFDGIINLVSSGVYLFLLGLILLFMTYNSLDIFNEYDTVMLRLHTKSNCFKQSVVLVLIINLIVLILNYILVFTFMNFMNNDFSIMMYRDYSINNLIYSVFSLIKSIVLFEALSLFFILIYKAFSKITSVCINIIILLPLVIGTYYDEHINTLSQMFLTYWDYFLNHIYSSFSLEVLCFLTYSLLLIFIFYIFYYIFNNRINFNSFKYIFFNDLFALKRFLKYFILFYILPTVIYFYINISSFADNSYLNVFSLEVTLLKFDIFDCDKMCFILYLINLFIIMFLVYRVLFNDKDSSNLFLRMSGFDWYKNKIFSIFILTFMYFLFKYLVLGLILLPKFNIFNNYFLMFGQFFNYAFLELLVVNSYLIIKNDKVSFLLSVIIMILGSVLYRFNIVIILFMIVSLFFISCVFLKEHHTSFIERR